MAMPTALQYSSIFSNMREKECADPVRDGLNSKNHGQQPTANSNYLPYGGTWFDCHCLLVHLFIVDESRSLSSQCHRLLTFCWPYSWLNNMDYVVPLQSLCPRMSFS
jgi:hypothetical protein